MIPLMFPGVNKYHKTHFYFIRNWFINNLYYDGENLRNSSKYYA